MPSDISLLLKELNGSSKSQLPLHNKQIKKKHLLMHESILQLVYTLITRGGNLHFQNDLKFCTPPIIKSATVQRSEC